MTISAGALALTTSRASNHEFSLDVIALLMSASVKLLATQISGDINQITTKIVPTRTHFHLCHDGDNVERFAHRHHWSSPSGQCRCALPFEHPVVGVR
jgi:hypothetical protein